MALAIGPVVNEDLFDILSLYVFLSMRMRCTSYVSVMVSHVVDPSAFVCGTSRNFTASLACDFMYHRS